MTFRHFVLSLAAVFVALAGGVVLGARMLSDPMMAGLRGDNEYLQQQISTLKEQQDALNRRLAATNDFGTQMSARIVADALEDKSVVLFRTPDADDSDVAGLADLITRAGGSVTGTIGLTSEFVGANAAEKLRSVVNSPIVPAGTALNTTLIDPGAQAGDLLGISILLNPDPTAPAVDPMSRDTVLTTLRDTGFVTFTDTPGPADAAVIVTGGALPDDAGNQGVTVARFAAALAPHGSGTVLAGRDGSAETIGAVAVTRSDTGLANLVTTVDNVDTSAGRITTVLAVESMLDGAPAEKYGIGPGAMSLTIGP
ncbi:MAG TPA: copper transporter [Mycobacterium sp.]|nr:MAG: copper transporter [Mycobacterium sp.]HOB49254.1 copper transporter [Mycobacterium sp.]HPZ95332.1 copper transporter [Mycobacterium sp.]HQE15905.1 copper transporter [Mycobacterium sp.]